MTLTKIDLLLNCKWIIPIVPENQTFTDCAIAIDNGRIVGLLPQAEAAQKFSAKKVENLAKERGIELMSRSQIRKLKATDRETYVNEYRAMSKEAALMMNESDPKPVNVADFVDHIDYLVKKIGLDHVGISSDFDGGGGIYGWNDASETLNVTAELLKRGYSEDQIGQLWSGNLLRVLDRVEIIAKKLQALDKV